MAVPILPGGLGIGEAAFGKLYLWFGSSEAWGVLASLLQRVFSWIMGFLGYLVYLWVPSIHPVEDSSAGKQPKHLPVAFPDPERTAAAG
jgi:hypothetical protein